MAYGTMDSGRIIPALGGSSRLALVVLCLYGFFKEIRPSEPFLTEYLLDPRWVNLSQDDLYNRVYPVWPYAYCILLVPVFVLTDYLRYKVIIVFEGLAYIATWSLLLWGSGVAQMRWMQFVYGIATSTEVAYYSYIYAKVPPEEFQKVSSITRSTLLLGRFCSGLLSQILTSLDLLDYRQLNFVSFSSVSLAFVISFFLPHVKSSVYFHRSTTGGGEQAATAKKGFCSLLVQVAYLVGNHVKLAYTNSYVVKWSIWAAVSTCANFQVGNYIQSLWEEIKPTTGSKQLLLDVSNSTVDEGGDQEIWNGAVEAATTLAGAMAVFAIGVLKLNWPKIGNISVAVVSGLSAALLFWMSQTHEIWVAYVGYLVYRMLYQVMMTVASFEIIKDLPEDSYALILGINTFVGLGMQVILTTVVNTQLELEPRPQFEVYAAYLLFPLAFFILMTILQFKRRGATLEITH